MTVAATRTYHYARLSDDERARWPLTAALLDCASYPDSARFWLWLSNLARAAGKRVTGAGEYEVAEQARFVDVLGVTTEYDYFLSFPPRR